MWPPTALQSHSPPFPTLLCDSWGLALQVSSPSSFQVSSTSGRNRHEIRGQWGPISTMGPRENESFSAPAFPSAKWDTPHKCGLNGLNVFRAAPGHRRRTVNASSYSLLSHRQPLYCSYTSLEFQWLPFLLPLQPRDSDVLMSICRDDAYIGNAPVICP